MKTTARLTIQTLPLSDKLRSELEQEIRECGELLRSGPAKRLPVLPVLGKLGCLTIFLGGLSYLLSRGDRSAGLVMLAVLGLGLIVGLGMALGLLPRDDFATRRYLSSVIRRNQELLKDGRVTSIRCRPLGGVQIEHPSVPGVHHHVFDVGDSTLLYLGCCGRDYQQLFPSHDFELLAYADSHTVWCKVSHASRLEPIRVLPPGAARRFRVPDGTIFTFPGTLDSLAADLRRRLPLRRSDESLWYC